jgi:hypothetical protein
LVTRLFKVPSSVTALVIAASTCMPAVALAQEQFHLPPWLHVSGSHRTRYEHLTNRFQPTVPGNDRALSLRTTLLAELRFKPVAVAVELMDSRVYLADEDTPLNTTHVNPVDALQAYVDANIADLFVD